MLKIGSPDVSLYPAEMRATRRWLCWKYLSGKKPPVDAQGNPLDNWNDPESWLTWEDAADRMADNPDVAGLGFMLGDDGTDAWVGVDLDDCIYQEDGVDALGRKVKTGETHPQAGGLLAFLKDAYQEKSPSGKGYKVFGRGPAPEWVEFNYKTGKLGGNRAARFFAVQGGGGGNPMVPINLEAVKVVLGGAGAEEPERKGPLVLPEVIQAGGQNDMLFRVACKHTRDGLSPTEVFAIVKAVQVERAPSAPGEPPWTDGDLQAIVASAARYGPTEDHFNNSESGDAEAFAFLHKDNVRYDHRAGRWLQFNGVRWRPQLAGEVERLALDTVRWRQAGALKIEDTARRTKRMDWASRGESSARRTSLLKLAKMEHPINSTGDEWDLDPWLLGVPNGVIDLRTGKLRDGRPEDNITMQTSIPYDPEARSALWESTLKEIFSNNQSLIDALQVRGGYTVTGDTRQDKWFMNYGKRGRNGKGTIFDAWFYALGDYSVELPADLFDLRKRGGDYDLAVLPGKRFARTGEAGDTIHLNHDRIKKLSGGGAIRAANKYEQSFQFDPVTKLWLECNDLPEVTDESTAFWARVEVIPFLRTFFGSENRDLRPTLARDPEHQKAVLAWLVKGAVRYCAEGLKTTAAITKASRGFQDSAWPLADFVEETCVEDANAKVAVKALNQAYLAWYEENQPLGKRLGWRKLMKSMENRFPIGDADYTDDEGKRHRERRYQGVGLRATERQEEAAVHEEEAVQVEAPF